MRVASLRQWWRLGALLLALGLSLMLTAEGLLAAQDQGSVTATVKVNPLEVSLTIVPSTVSVGDQFTVQARVDNLGSSRIRRVTATLQVPGVLVDVRRPETKRLRPLEPFGDRFVEWQLTATGPGGFVLMVTASGVDSSDRIALTAEDQDDSLTAESTAALVTVD